MSSMDLVSLDEFKTYRGITTDKDDPKIMQLIKSATDLTKTYCNRSFIDFYSTDKIEYFDGTKYSEFFLEEGPIVSVTEVAYTEDGSTYTALVEGTDYFVNDEQDSIFIKGGVPLLTLTDFPAKSIKITFTGGYETAPEDVKQAVLDLVEYYRTEQFTPRKAASGVTLENIGFRAGSSIGLPPHIKRILEMYRVQ